MQELPLYSGALPQYANVDPKLAMRAAATPGAGLLGASIAKLGAGLAQQEADFHRLNDSAQFHLFARNQRERDARARMELQDGLLTGKFRRADGTIDMDKVEELKVKYRDEAEGERHEFFFPDADQRYREAREEAVSGFGLFADQSLRQAALKDANDTFNANFQSAMKIGDWQGAVAAISDAHGTVLNPAQADGLLLDVKRAKADNDLTALLHDDPQAAFDAIDGGGVDEIFSPAEVTAWRVRAEKALRVPRPAGKGKYNNLILTAPPGASEEQKKLIDEHNQKGEWNMPAVRAVMFDEARKLEFSRDPLERERQKQDMVELWENFGLNKGDVRNALDIQEEAYLNPGKFVPFDTAVDSLDIASMDDVMFKQQQALLAEKNRLELLAVEDGDDKDVKRKLKHNEIAIRQFKELWEPRKKEMINLLRSDWNLYLIECRNNGVTPSYGEQYNRMNEIFERRMGKNWNRTRMLMRFALGAGNDAFVKRKPDVRPAREPENKHAAPLSRKTALPQREGILPVKGFMF